LRLAKAAFGGASEGFLDRQQFLIESADLAGAVDQVDFQDPVAFAA
jgi:hypothetical protein